MKNFTVNHEEENQRLDLFLTLKLPEFSRSQIRRQINNGTVSINGQVEFKPNFRVKENLEVAIDDSKFAVESPEIVPENIPLDVVYEDRDLVVINKPAGMVVHPATANWQGTLMNALLYRYRNMQNIGDASIRFGLIHRLDKDTSGLILIGKSNLGLWHYSRQFAERQVEKVYLAVVSGDINKLFRDKTYTVRDYLARNPKNRKKISAVSESGRLAETSFAFVRHVYVEGKLASLVKAMPKTGRTHQIRVHLSGLGYPVVGDKIYGKANIEGQRLLLHAWKITVKLLSGIKQTFTAAVPPEFGM